MLHLKVRAGFAEDIRVLSIRVRAGGTGDDSTEITAVRLIRDVDGDGAVGVGDIQAGNGTFSADNGSVDFDTSAEPNIPAGTDMHYLAVCDFSATAFTGNDFSFTVAVPAGVNCQSGFSMTGVTPTGTAVFGGVKTLATSGVGSLTVTAGGNNPVAGTRGYPQNDVPVLQLLLTASSLEGANVSRIRLAAGGTGNESAGITAKLVRDSNGDGQVSTGDVTLSTGAISGDNGTVDFNGLAIVVAANSSVTLLAVYDFGAGTVPGTGPTLTLAPGGAGSGTGAVYFMGGCGAPLFALPSGWLGLFLLLTSFVGLLRATRTR
jgi:hypothetical protein